MKKEQRKLQKKTKGSNNYEKQRIKLRKEYEKLQNKKKDSINKICSYLFNNYKTIAVQDENIKGWHAGWFGRHVQQSILGGIMTKLKNNSATQVVDRYFPSTKTCPECGMINKVGLEERTYSCECGYSKDRDIHPAMNLLLKATNNLIPEVLRKFKPVEFNTSAFDSLICSINSNVSIDYEAGRYDSLELC